MVKNIIETGIPRVKQYMSERNEALQVSDIAEYLEVSTSSAFGLLDLMYAFGIIDKAKRERTYYFLKDTYSDEQIIAMLPPKKLPLARVRLYDEMLNKFIDSGHRLVEITIENRNTSYVKRMLKKKIEERGLTDQVDVSRVDEWIYLEKVE